MVFMNSCSDCRNYHGRSYADNLLVCAIHPYGTDQKCLDFDPKENYFDDLLPVCFQLFASEALSQGVVDLLLETRSRILPSVFPDSPYVPDAKISIPRRDRILPCAFLEEDCNTDLAISG